MTENQSNPFSGKWILQRTETKKSDDSWKLSEYCRFAKRIWRFEPDYERSLKWTYVCHFGHVVYEKPGYKPDADIFCYIPNDSTLCIDDPKASGEDWNTKYRVERPNNSTVILYLLDIVQTGTDEPCCRFVFKKFSLPALLREYIVGSFMSRKIYP